MELNIEEMTGRESGIIIYDDYGVIICNWSGRTGLPRMFVHSPIFMGEEISELPEAVRAENVADILPEEIDLIYDINGDMDQILKDMPGGWVYQIPEKEICIIVPDEWC